MGDTQGRSQVFESEGVPFCLKNWEGPSKHLTLSSPKSGGAQAPLAVKVVTTSLSLTGSVSTGIFTKN